VHFFRLLTDYASSQNLPIEKLLEKTNIRAELLDDPNARIPFGDFDRLCALVAERLDDPCLGLKLGQNVRPGHLGSHGLAMMSCATAAELIQQAARYSALTIDAGYNVFERRGTEYIRYWRSNIPGRKSLGRLHDELQQAALIGLARWFSNRHDLKPNWASFQHSRPPELHEYEAVFRCPLRFDATETAISMDSAIANLPLPHANSQLRRIMDDLSAQLLEQLGSALEPSWLAIARKAALDSLSLEGSPISVVAKAAALTEAELKAKLAERGESYRSFVDDLRRGLALGYVRDPNLGLVDIACLLGFSEQSAFQRAFKRWTGVTPRDYRQNVPISGGVEATPIRRQKP